MKKLNRIYAAVVILLCIALVRIHANTYVGKWPKPTAWKEALNYQWANEPWTGNNEPFQHMRRQIDTAIASGTPAEQLRLYYAVLAQKKPSSPSAMFQWAYSCWKASVAATTTGDREYALYTVPEGFVDVPNPHTYDYDRVRFLINPANPALLSLANRLIKQVPDDVDVKKKMLNIMMVNVVVHPSTKASADAISLANQLLQVEPNDPKSYARRGAVYYFTWEHTHAASDQSSAVKDFQEYLQKSPATDDWRSSAVRYIKRMQDAR